ncbi:LUD domain-containing protein [Granulibacter bethesdensis]|nr:LUD domain-containing protein [Granulibacter bethesdensis]
MSAGSSANPSGKETILATLRRGLRRGVLPPDQAAMLDSRLATHPRHTIPERARKPAAERRTDFIARVQKEFGTTEEVASSSDIPSAIARYLASRGLPGAVTVAPHPALHSLDWSASGIETEWGRVHGTESVSVQYAFAGISETGTLMMPSAPERPVTLNVLTETAIAVLPVERIVGAYEDAWDLLRTEIGAMPRSVMLITGPSRSGDIEQQLELGAHGPRNTHIILFSQHTPPAPHG